ncbi:SAM-dependent methyltransferase [Streptomyces sp. NPDC058417]|uniref:SAM-dependent methyltransferase n=1 Tax=unclassified Streptomyces TaxID=2593676 RepID=UPI003662F321
MNVPTTPNAARLQDALDDGTDNYIVDRAFAERLLDVAPWLRASVRTNRAHGPQILDHFTREYGIDQVLDLGCGLPHDNNKYLPDAVRRIVYVDSDPDVDGHARMRLAERHGTASLLADLKNTPALLAAGPVARLDRSRPIGVLLHDVLPWIDDDTATAALAALRAWLPDGSVLSVTHATTDTDPEGMAALTRLYAEADIHFQPRSARQIHELLGSWTQVEDDGLVTTASWHQPVPLHDRFDLSHAYAILVSPPDRPA